MSEHYKNILSYIKTYNNFILLKAEICFKTTVYINPN